MYFEMDSVVGLMRNR